MCAQPPHEPCAHTSQPFGPLVLGGAPSRLYREPEPIRVEQPRLLSSRFPLLRVSLKQLDLAGPAEFVSMEDGCIGNFVEHGVAAATKSLSQLEMAGDGAESQETRATDKATHGF